MKKTPCFLLLLVLGSCAPDQRGGISSMQPTSGHLDIDGGSFYYEVLGEGPALVLIHGGFGDRRMWDDQFQEFSRRFRVIRYDHRGFGRSSAPAAAYSPVQDLLALLDHFKIDRATLVGNSMGGALALDFALEHPQRVSSVVMVSSGPSGYPFTEEDGRSVIAVFQAASEKGTAQAARMWLEHPMVGVSSQTPGVRERLQTMIEENKEIFQMQFWPEEALQPPAYQRLSEVTIPTLVLTGDQDTQLVRTAADSAARGIPGARRIVIEGADHLPQMVRPAQFNSAVLAFLRGS